MSTAVTNQSNTVPSTGVKALSQFLNSDGIKNKFVEILGSKGNGFVASMLSAVSQSDLLKDADQNSIYTCGLMAASLDLPINPSLGMAYLIAYNVKQSDGTFKKMCQFQIGYKGLKQLAQRSGQFQLMTEAVVFEGQLVEENPLTGYKFDWKRKQSDTVIGYVSYFELINGFKSTLYMTVADVKKHGAKYSKTFKSQYGVWNTEFDAMALKTVSKLNLSRNAPLSIEMQKATVADQMVIKNFDEQGSPEGEYIDVTEPTLNISAVNETKSRERIVEWIQNSKTLEELNQVSAEVTPDDDDLFILFEDKKRTFTAKK